MTPSDDFKAQLKAGNIPEALALALNGAVDLKITTWVTSATDPQPTAPGKRLRTRINTIEGKVDNEVGDQFIGNGPYRELRQFHIDQVAQGNEIIHSNLKSLQTLFDVVIAMQKAQRRIATLPTSSLPLVLEPSSEVEQLLPAAPDHPDAATITEPAAEVEELPPTTSSLADLALPAIVSWGVAATVLNIPDSTPEALEEDAESLVSSLDSTPEALDDDDEEDDHWDDSVLDLLESLPIGEPPELEELDSPEAEDWRNFIEEDDTPEPPKLDSPIDQDWGILTQEDFEPPQTVKEPVAFQEDLGELIKDEPETASLNAESKEPVAFQEDLGELIKDEPETASLNAESKEPVAFQEDLGELIKDEPETASLNAESKEPVAFQEDLGELIKDEPETASLNAESKEPVAFQEDLGELIKDEPETASLNAESSDQNWEKLSFEDLQPPPVAPIPTDETSSASADEDWGDLIEDEPQLPPSQPVPSLDSLNLESEDEWDDWVMESEPLQDSPLKRLESLDLEDDGGWDDFEENADPFAAVPTNSASNLDDADWDNFAVDELEPYTGLLELDTNLGASFDLSGDFEGLTDDEPKDNRFSELNKPSAQDADDLMAVLFGDEPQDINAEAKKSEEELFADMRFEEFLANGNSPEDELKITPSELEPKDTPADLGQPPSGETIILPPPPPSQLPKQNN
jgi:hypothetical protein